MKTPPFVPSDFEVPPMLETEQFRLRMLSVDHVKMDYEAVMESADLLHVMFEGEWPRDGFTLEENLADMEMHQQEFLERKAFAYTVISLDETRVLGCLYINPPKEKHEDASVVMWVRQSEFDLGLDPILFNAVKTWLIQSWTFNSVAYPGRE